MIINKGSKQMEHSLPDPDKTGTKRSNLKMSRAKPQRRVRKFLRRF